MSSEAVVPAILGSFVYEGCYRPRGSLTFAERSAWGLRSFGDRPQAATTSAFMPETRVFAHGFRPVTFTQLKPQGSTHSGGAIARRSKRRARFRVGCLSSAAVRYAKRFVSPHVSTKTKRFAGWYRLSVKVAGGSATCLLARGRSFVTGDIRARNRIR